MFFILAGGGAKGGEVANGRTPFRFIASKETPVWPFGKKLTQDPVATAVNGKNLTQQMPYIEKD
jgi:hypothetical protein